ncbi:hypothetical protein FRB90_007425 [Tulasnella sp. 427]|nr:hypothetical protein FRB90_007425 [Tulasnella sp. 427]
MDAPQISTLDAKEDTPQPVEPIPETASISRPAPSAKAAPATTKPSEAGRGPVYVDDDEEDQLIDDDDDVAGPPARTAPAEVAEHPRTAIPDRLANHPPRQQLTPTPSVVSVASEPSTSYAPPPAASQPAQSTTPRRRGTKPRKTEEAPSIVTSPVSSAPTAKKKRNRNAAKATLEVGRQEPETHDNTGTTSAWRLEAGPSSVGQPMQMTIVQQDEISFISAASSTKQPTTTNTKRKRAPKATSSAAPPAEAPSADSNSAAPPPRKRPRTQPKKSVPVQEEGTPDYYPPSAYPDIPQDVGTSTPYDYYSVGPPTHVDQFRIPENGIEEVSEETLAAAPLRPLHHFTNTVAPGSFIPWQTYTGPLERTGKKCRRWTPVQRSIKTIGGGVWFAKTWVGGTLQLLSSGIQAKADWYDTLLGERTEIEHVRPPLVLEPPKVLVEGPALSVASEAEKPTKLPRTNKPRERKSKIKSEGGGSASATATPPTHASTPIPSLADASAELEKLAPDPL